MNVLGVVWHWWIALPHAAAAVVAVVAVIIGYVKAVIMPQYPPK